MSELVAPVGHMADSVGVIPLDDELSVFDSSTGAALALNRTAADVLSFADGSTSLGEVIRTLAEAYQVDAERIVDDVRAAVDQLTDAGVIRPAE